jgi:hypothetical protein
VRRAIYIRVVLCVSLKNLRPELVRGMWQFDSRLDTFPPFRETEASAHFCFANTVSHDICTPNMSSTRELSVKPFPCWQKMLLEGISMEMYAWGFFQSDKVSMEGKLKFRHTLDTN